MINPRRGNHDEAKGGIRALLSHPGVYTLLGRILGLSEKYKMYVDRFIKPFNNMKILDIGCGTASILNFLPLNVQYTGYDINPDYIRYAKRKFGHRADFHNHRVNEMDLLNSESYDMILADGLLHHLDELEAQKLFQIAYSVLKKDGFVLTIDPTFVPKQNRIDCFLTSMDRGQHIRHPEDYKRIAESSFHRIEVHIICDVSIIPLTGCILKCWKEQ